MFNFEDIREINVMAPELRKENCKLTKIERNKDDKSFSFIFVDGTGATLTDRSFVPNKLSQMTDEDFKKSVALNVNRIAHICRAFVSEQEFLSVKVEEPNNLSKVADNWIKITDQVGKLLATKIKAGADMTCALKVIYKLNKKDKKYYSALPQVAPFISTANHPKQFTINPQYDVFEIPKIAPDIESAPTQGVTTNTTGAATESSDMEF